MVAIILISSENSIVRLGRRVENHGQFALDGRPLLSFCCLTDPASSGTPRGFLGHLSVRGHNCVDFK